MASPRAAHIQACLICCMAGVAHGPCYAPRARCVCGHVCACVRCERLRVRVCMCAQPSGGGATRNRMSRGQGQ
eukprot:5235572-Alexandrium_andersonii.AAC.1